MILQCAGSFKYWSRCREFRISNLESRIRQRSAAQRLSKKQAVLSSSKHPPEPARRAHSSIEFFTSFWKRDRKVLRLPLSRICAITFTEKAAGEMKVRLRQYLEQILLDAKASEAHLERAREALNDLETAAIPTFHSFAVSLLKERPIEAGLDPHFTALDEIRSELFFREVWDAWISRALMERNPILEKALRNGFRLETLKDLARILRQNWLNIRDLECDAPLTEEQYLAKMRGIS